MEQVVEKYGWKKVAIVLVGSGLLGVVFVLMSFSSLDREAMEIVKKKSNGSTTQTISRTDPFSQGGSGLREYKTNYYTVSIPEFMTLESFQPSSSAFNSIKLSDKENSAIIEIAVLNTSNVNVTEMSNNYSLLGYDKREYNHPAGSVIEYNGTVGNTNVHQRVAFLRKGNNVIRYLASYSSGNINQQIEQLFSDIFLSIK